MINQLIIDFANNLAREGFSSDFELILDNEAYARLEFLLHQQRYVPARETPYHIITIRTGHGQVWITPIHDRVTKLEALDELVTLTSKELLLTSDNAFLREAGRIKSCEEK